MHPYRDLSTTSGVAAYDLRDDGIAVQFKDGKTYLYTSRSAGAVHVAAMKRLAQRGAGLATYINQHVRDRYAKKW